MHRVAVVLGIGAFIWGVGSALWAWWGHDLGPVWGFPPDVDHLRQVWLGMGEALLGRLRQVVPVAWPIGLAAGLGALEGMDWRLSTRMRGHHAHLLSYGAGVAWATGGWIAFALLRPVPLPVPSFAGPCLLASVAMGFCVTAGLPARGNG